VIFFVVLAWGEHEEEDGRGVLHGGEKIFTRMTREARKHEEKEYNSHR